MVLVKNVRNVKHLYSVIYKYTSRFTFHVSRLTPNAQRPTFNF